jgi:serine/threonine-protein kinase
MRVSRIIICLLLGVLLAQSVYYYPNLPDIVASHFDGSGKPNGWMSKSAFFMFEAVILLLILAEFTLLPFLIKKSPDRLISLPNKDYWLAEKRRDQTFASLGHYFEWFSILLVSLFIVINQLVFQANLTRQNISSEAIWLAIGGFTALVVVWSVKFIRLFRIKEYES